MLPQDYASTSVSKPMDSGGAHVRHLDDPDVGDDLELRGLLSGVRTVNESGGKHRALHDLLDDNAPWSRKRMASVSIVLIVIILGASLTSLNVGRWKGKIGTPSHPNSQFVGSELRSNGTHDFRRTVLIVSIDGLR